MYLTKNNLGTGNVGQGSWCPSPAQVRHLSAPLPSWQHPPGSYHDGGVV